jgi:acyl carrier protein phosphodiesterase
MNYLAHAFLSFKNDDVLTGNMISDYVKGKKQYDYPKSIQAGITLHRAIDDFTDTHDATRKLKEFFRPAYRLYSGAFGDVVYDYFLANDRSQFPSSGELQSFTLETYASLEEKKHFFPEPFSRMFPYMQSQNWLYNYQYEEGIQKSFGGLARRAKYIEETHTAFNLFLMHKKQMQLCYDEFFPAVKSFAAHKMEQLLSI